MKIARVSRLDLTGPQQHYPTALSFSCVGRGGWISVAGTALCLNGYANRAATTSRLPGSVSRWRRCGRSNRAATPAYRVKAPAGNAPSAAGCSQRSECFCALRYFRASIGPHNPGLGGPRSRASLWNLRLQPLSVSTKFRPYQHACWPPGGLRRSSASVSGVNGPLHGLTPGLRLERAWLQIAPRKRVQAGQFTGSQSAPGSLRRRNRQFHFVYGCAIVPQLNEQFLAAWMRYGQGRSRKPVRYGRARKELWIAGNGVQQV